MADPRGLSGAVFQPTQIRDFTQDLLVSNQYKAKKEAASQKALQDDLSQYDTGDINNGYHRQVVGKAIIPKIKELTLLKAEAKQNGDRDAEMRYDRQLRGVTNNFKALVPQLNRFDTFAIENYKNLQKAQEEGYAGEEYTGNVNQMTMMNEAIGDAEVEIDEEGNIYFDGVPQGELLRPQLFSANKPKEYFSDRILKRPGVNAGTFVKINPDGSETFNEKKANVFYEIEANRGEQSPEFVDSLIEAIRIRSGQTVSGEEALIKVQEDRTILDEAQQIFVEDMRRIASSKPAKSDDDRGGETKKSLNDITEVFTDEFETKAAIELKPNSLFFNTTEKLKTEDGKESEFSVKASLKSYRIKDNGDVIGQFTFSPSMGISQESTRKLSKQDIASIEASLPQGETLKSFYENKIGKSTPSNQKPQTQTAAPKKKGLMSGF